MSGGSRGLPLKSEHHWSLLLAADVQFCPPLTRTKITAVPPLLDPPMGRCLRLRDALLLLDSCSLIFYLQAGCLRSSRAQWLEASTPPPAPLHHLYSQNK